ncbi:MAG: hypothetical protein E6G59_09200 [Actinobacteria bacterium]|nr:MAG: hypothetical protein E6G59_09200 [Actinomycetota bacterium]
MYRRFEDGATEQFRCAPGPMGWRYFSTIQDARGATNVDLSVDAAWRPVRVRILTPEHHVLMSARGSIQDDEPLDVPFDPETITVDFGSPCFPLATARRLGGSGEIDATVIDGEAGELMASGHATHFARAVDRRGRRRGRRRTGAGRVRPRRTRLAAAVVGRARRHGEAGRLSQP